MELWKYDGKQVRIKTTDNMIFKGKAYDFIPAQDNVPEIASITIDSIEIFENEIATIEEIWPFDIQPIKGDPL